jgi:hypothetical protein
MTFARPDFVQRLPGRMLGQRAAARLLLLAPPRRSGPRDQPPRPPLCVSLPQLGRGVLW